MHTFHDLFGRDPAVTTHAPGRVNLIGEHTDYNGGFVLPSPIPQHTTVGLLPRSDDTVRVASDSVAGGLRSYRLGEEHPGHDWLDFVQGVTRILRAEGHALHGFEALVSSDVPLGSGLSSSASLTVSLMRALRAAFTLKLDDLKLARLCQRVENEFVGAQVGVMDPMACSLGEEGGALFIDTRTLQYKRLPLPAGADLVVLNSGVAHRHSAGDYNTRRSECERACGLLGVRQLRDLDLSALPRLVELPEPLGRRARHVITENARVLAAVESLQSNDLERLGKLFFESHESQRDDYAVSVAELDLLVKLARADADVYGARLTGGGFGGSIVLLARAGRGTAVARRLAESYARQSACQPTILVPPTLSPARG
jgi:galactokinase